jgi:hypothetical protein
MELAMSKYIYIVTDLDGVQKMSFEDPVIYKYIDQEYKVPSEVWSTSCEGYDPDLFYFIAPNESPIPDQKAGTKKCFELVEA